MATKNLARTVIEGGRAGSNRFDRRYSNSQERRAVRQLCARLSQVEDPDGAVYPPRRPVHRFFDDKLGPAYRWLESQIGRPWSKVRSELVQRFDARTTAGRHILFDHLLREVEGEPFSWIYRRFHVDRRGFLRRVRREKIRWQSQRDPLPESEESLERWMDGRRIGERGTILYWFEPTESGFFRQTHALTSREARRWCVLPEWYRQERRMMLPETTQGDRSCLPPR